MPALDPQTVQIADEDHFEAGCIIFPFIHETLSGYHFVHNILRRSIGISQVGSGSCSLVQGDGSPQKCSVIISEVPILDQAAAGAFDMIVDLAAVHQG
ncbi:hypothetical protein D3C73_794450 [compost metagenome]